MNLLKELAESENDKNYLPIFQALEEALNVVQRNTKGGILSKANQFYQKNPGLVIGAAAFAVMGYNKYKKNKRNTVNLHAKNAYEKKMMTSIVDVLKKDGIFKIERIKFENGGKTWVLRRKWN